MRDNSYDRTIERNYLQKWRFLIPEYEAVKAGRSDLFKRVGDFYRHHWNLFADVPQVLQPLSAERGRGRLVAAPPQTKVAGAARARRDRGGDRRPPQAGDEPALRDSCRLA